MLLTYLPDYQYLNELHEMLKKNGDWMDPGSAANKKQQKGNC